MGANDGRGSDGDGDVGTSNGRAFYNGFGVPTLPQSAGDLDEA